MKNSKLLKIILIALILSELIVCLIYYFAFMDLKNKNNNILLLKSQLASKIEKQKYAVSMEQMIKNTNSDIVKINDSILEKNSNVKFIEQIENLARNNGANIKINSLSYLDNSDIIANDLTVLYVSGTMTGNWNAVYSFLHQIESLPFKIKINKFGMTNTTDSPTINSSKNQWQAVFEINVLEYK